MSAHKRHILVMSSWFPNRIDPYVGNFVQRFAELLTVNYAVTVIHTLGDKKIRQLEIDETTEENVRILRIYHPISKNKLIHWWNQRKALRTGLRMVEEVDLIFGHVFLPRGFQFEKAKRYFHCPLVIMEHASYYRKTFRKRLTSIQRSLIKSVSRNVKQIIAVSPVLAKDMKVLFPTTKIDVIPNFVKEEHFPMRLDLPIKAASFLHVSTLDTSTKNPKMLFEGFEKAVKEKGLNEIHLTVVSDQNTDNWQKWVNEHNLTAHVSFVGPVDWSTIGELMRKHDALILTSEYESFSIVLAEAWLSGIPVISTSVGIAHQLPKHLGIQLEQNSTDSLMHALDKMHSGNFQYNSKEMHIYAQQFTEDIVRAQLETCFERYFDQHE